MNLIKLSPEEYLNHLVTITGSLMHVYADTHGDGEDCMDATVREAIKVLDDLIKVTNDRFRIPK